MLRQPEMLRCNQKPDNDQAIIQPASLFNYLIIIYILSREREREREKEREEVYVETKNHVYFVTKILLKIYSS